VSTTTTPPSATESKTHPSTKFQGLQGRAAESGYPHVHPGRGRLS
jgi:hypothetical protein